MVIRCYMAAVWNRRGKLPDMLDYAEGTLCGGGPLKKDKDRREGEGSCCCLGDVRELECRTNHLAAKMIRTIVLGRTSILAGWWFGIV